MGSPAAPELREPESIATEEARMKVGLLGSGDVGRSLGRAFIRHGHEAMIGSRDPAKLADWTAEVGDAGSTGSFADAASSAS